MSDDTQKIVSLKGSEESSQQSRRSSEGSGSSKGSSNPIPPYDDTLTKLPPSMTRGEFFERVRKELKETEALDDGTIGSTTRSRTASTKARRQSLAKLEDQIHFQADSAQTPLLSRVRDPFEETPESGTRSEGGPFDGNGVTPSTPLAKNGSHGGTTASSIFRRLRDQQEATTPFEFDSELGIVLDGGREGEDFEEGDSAIKLNLNGAVDFKNLLENIEGESTQDASKKTGETIAYTATGDQAKDRKERDPDFSLLSEINDTTGDYEMPTPHGSDDVQVPNSVNNTANGGVISKGMSRNVAGVGGEDRNVAQLIVLPHDTQVLGTQEEGDAVVSERILVASSPRSSQGGSPKAAEVGEVFSGSAGQEKRSSTQNSLKPSTQNVSDFDSEAIFAETLRIESAEKEVDVEVEKNGEKGEEGDIVWTNRHKQAVISSQSEEIHIKETMEIGDNNDSSSDVDLDNYEVDANGKPRPQPRELRSQTTKSLSTNVKKHGLFLSDYPSHPYGILRKIETDTHFNAEDYQPFGCVFVDDRGSKIPVRLVDVWRETTGEAVFEISNSNGSSHVFQNSILAPVLLRVGDPVKYSKDRRYTYKITGLEYVERDSEENLTCVRGYNTVFIQRKTKGSSSKELKVPLDDIYMNLNEYRGYHFRVFDDPDQFERLVNELINDRPRRKRSKVAEDDPTAISADSRCFDGCLFAMTMPTGFEDRLSDKQLADVEHFIVANGGTILPGFEKYVRVVPVKGSYGDYSLEVDRILLRFKFVTLLSTRHIRTLKYLQCLAFGWPILSFQFIFDCINNPCCRQKWQSQWPSYLLPAGVSTYRGCTLSLNVLTFVQGLREGLSAFEQVGINTKLFAGSYIIVDNTKRGDLGDEALLLLLRLLGFDRILFLDNGLKYDGFVEAMTKLDISGKTNACYVYSGHNDKYLNKMIESGSKKKSKRRSGRRKSRGLYPSCLKGIELKLVDWEWLVQCIIGGFVFDRDQLGGKHQIGGTKVT
ncbi:DEKNAAC101172 [Brettanomyces naardenensis]|uniref:DEKNAAC101172 n=1 Tax=Brettanomyces naardenensis TaxID=13370 RepID=A0A448YHG8_BRENA|nr:DEKNAAC101172 [Brettanomyces naardenensis]